jgi:hypothetical protein
MRINFDKAFEITVGLEGKYSNDPNDPGGETKYGISKHYHPNEDIYNLTLARAKEIYLNEYWAPAGCDAASYPMDMCLFDSQVNPQNDPRLPGGGNQEILLQNPENWQDYLLLRMIRYMKNSKDIYVKGHLFRVLKLSEILRRK